MKFFRLPIIFVAAAACTLHAQQTDDQDRKPIPQEDIPDFSNLDEYVYQPKSNLNFGFRYISGVKAKFSGNGYVAAPEDLPLTNGGNSQPSRNDAFLPNVSRTYHDGDVQPDSRAVNINNGDGTASSQAIPSDGKTNTWAYTSSSQVTADDYLQLNIYGAQTLDSGSHSKDGKGTLGLELSSARDMGDLGKHWSWRLFGGMSINDIQAATSFNVLAKVTTVTDTYDLFGQAPPSSLSSVSGSSLTVTNANGSTVYDAAGNPITVATDTTTLLGNVPLARAVSAETDSTSVTDDFKLHGAYAYFRGGPMLVYSPTERFHVNLSAGPALIYAGSSFQATEIFNTATGTQVVDYLASTESKVVLGGFAEVTLQYDLTDRTGFYFGATFQDGGSYVQSVTGNIGSASMYNLNLTDQYGNPAKGTTTLITGDPMVTPTSNSPTAGNLIGTYSTRVEFSNQEGFRAGMAFKF
jgi:hypothetical protein